MTSKESILDISFPRPHPALITTVRQFGGEKRCQIRNCSTHLILSHKYFLRFLFLCISIFVPTSYTFFIFSSFMCAQNSFWKSPIPHKHSVVHRCMALMPDTQFLPSLGLPLRAHVLRQTLCSPRQASQEGTTNSLITMGRISSLNFSRK